MSRQAIATAAPSASPGGDAPNPPPLPEQRPEPLTGSGRTAYLVPTFLGNNVERDDLDAAAPAEASHASSSKVMPRSGSASAGPATGTGRLPESPTKRYGTPTGLAAEEGPGKKLHPKRRSRISRNGARSGTSPSERRASLAEPGKPRGNRRTLLLLGGGVAALLGVVALGLLMMPREEIEEEAKGEPRTERISGPGQEEATEVSEPTFSWPDGEFPAFTQEPSVQRTLQVESSAAIRAVRINDGGLESRTGFAAQLLTLDGSPIDSLEHTEFLVEITVNEDQRTDTFVVELEHNRRHIFETEFRTRIDRIPPQVRFVEPQTIHRIDTSPDAPFRLAQREVDLVARVLDFALESVTLTTPWNERRIEVPVEDPSEVRIERRLRFPSDGTFEILIEARDQAGNVTQQAQPFIVDATPPRFTIGQPSPDGSPEFTVDTEEIVVEGTVRDEGGVADVRPRGVISVSGEPGDTQRDFRFTMQLSPGLNEFPLTATDLAGNVTEVVLRITFEDPELPRVDVLRIDGRQQWRRGQEPMIELDETNEGDVVLEIEVENLLQPRVWVNGDPAEALADESSGAVFVFRHRLTTYDGMRMEIEVDGVRRQRIFEFYLQRDMPMTLRLLEESPWFDLERFVPAVQDAFRKAADFTHLGEEVALATREVPAELLLCSLQGQLMPRYVPLGNEHAIDRFRGLGRSRFAFSTVDGHVAIVQPNERGEMGVTKLDLRIEPGSDWQVLSDARLALQLPGGSVAIVHYERGTAVSLPLSGRPDGPMLVLGNDRYLVVARGENLVVWSLPMRHQVATLPIQASHLAAGEGAVWYAAGAANTVWRLEGFDAEAAQSVPLSEEIVELARLADGRLIVQVRGERPEVENDGPAPVDEEAAEIPWSQWHLLDAELGELETKSGIRVNTLVSCSESGIVWGLCDGFLVRLRLER